METLDDLEHLDNFFRRDAGRETELFRGGLEVAVFVDIADDQLGDGALLFRQLGKPELFDQVFLQGGPDRERVEHELALLFILERLSRGKVGLGKMIAPFLVELGQFLELGLEIIDWLGAGLFRGGVKTGILGRLGGVSLVRSAIFFGGDLPFLVHFGDFGFFQDGILLEFLLDERFEFEGGGLEQCEGLLQLRRQHLRQRHFLR